MNIGYFLASLLSLPTAVSHGFDIYFSCIDSSEIFWRSRPISMLRNIHTCTVAENLNFMAAARTLLSMRCWRMFLLTWHVSTCDTYYLVLNPFISDLLVLKTISIYFNRRLPDVVIFVTIVNKMSWNQRLFAFISSIVHTRVWTFIFLKLCMHHNWWISRECLNEIF